MRPFKPGTLKIVGGAPLLDVLDRLRLARLPVTGRRATTRGWYLVAEGIGVTIHRNGTVVVRGADTVAKRTVMAALSV